MTLQGQNSGGTNYSGVLSGNVGTLTATGGGLTMLQNPANSFVGDVHIAGNNTVLQAGDGTNYGFDNKSSWTLNGGKAFFDSTDILHLTNENVFGQEGSAFFNSTVPTTGNFVAQFTYQANASSTLTPNVGGIAFVLQNASSSTNGGGGASALGSPGDALGYSGMHGPSLAVSLNYSPNSPAEGVGTSLTVNGNTIAPDRSTGLVPLSNADPKLVTLSYDAAAQTLTEELTDTINNATDIVTFTGVNLATLFGGSSAYVGFTGSGSQRELINDFVFNPGTYLPITSSVDVGAGSTFQPADVQDSINGLTGGGTVMNYPNINMTLTIGANNGGGVFSGVIEQLNGNVGVVKAGTGTETFSGANLYGQGTIIEAGTLQISGVGGLGANVFSYNQSPVTLNDIHTGSQSASLLTDLSGGTINNPIVVANFGTGTDHHRHRRRQQRGSVRRRFDPEQCRHAPGAKHRPHYVHRSRVRRRHPDHQRRPDHLRRLRHVHGQRGHQQRQHSSTQ